MTRFDLVALASAALLACGAASAADKPAPAKKPASAKAAPAPKVAPLPTASAEQIDAAERTLFGAYACEFNQTVDVGMNPKTPGYVDVAYKGKIYTMKPVMSSTGALRLEDVTGRTLMLQIANKSMLMDTKVGQRLVDNCIHPDQAKFNATRS